MHTTNHSGVCMWYVPTLAYLWYLVPYPPVAPYADPSGDTTRLCLCKHSIDLLSQIEMKTKVYNPGGIGRARLAERMDSALERCKLC